MINAFGDNALDNLSICPTPFQDVPVPTTPDTRDINPGQSPKQQTPLCPILWPVNEEGRVSMERMYQAMDPSLSAPHLTPTSTSGGPLLEEADLLGHPSMNGFGTTSKGLLQESAQILHGQRAATNFLNSHPGQSGVLQPSLESCLGNAKEMTPEQDSQLLLLGLLGNSEAKASQLSLDAYSNPALQAAQCAVSPPLLKATSTNLYKTELCRAWSKTASCSYGSKCQFAHGIEEQRLTPLHPKYKTQMCRTFLKTGMCRYGAKCCFIHKEPTHSGLGFPSVKSDLVGDSPTLSSQYLTSSSLTNLTSPYISGLESTLTLDLDSRLNLDPSMPQRLETPLSPLSEVYLSPARASVGVAKSSKYEGLSSLPSNPFLRPEPELGEQMWGIQRPSPLAGNASMALDNFGLQDFPFQGGFAAVTDVTTYTQPHNGYATSPYKQQQLPFKSFPSF